MNRPTFEKWAMEIAKSVSTRSPDPKLQVGCILISFDFRRIIGMGYNGSVQGQSNERVSLEPGKSKFIHAEINALINHSSPMESGKLFVTTAPCEDCARVIANSNKVTHVYYNQEYRNSTGLEVLKISNIEVIKLE